MVDVRRGFRVPAPLIPVLVGSEGGRAQDECNVVHRQIDHARFRVRYPPDERICLISRRDQHLRDLQRIAWSAVPVAEPPLHSSGRPPL
jgi:hypothetical protein